MNIWLTAILAIIISSYLLDLIASTLNLKALSPELPREFKDVFDRTDYQKSQLYTRKKTQFSLIESSVTTSITLLFLLAGGFNVIDEGVRALGFGSVTTGLLFTAALMFLSLLLTLPFSIYSTFVIEDQFGFNRTTPRTFILDGIKSIILALVIGGPLLALVLWFFEYSGPYAWIYCWVGVFLITLILQFLAPVLIMPLFNTFTPLEAGPLKEAILAYTKGEKFKINGVFVMDGSKRSTKLNAFFTGFGKYKKIVFFDTLLTKLSNEQILAVLAHEMGHYKHKHLIKMLCASFLQTGIVFYFFSIIMNNTLLFAAFSMSHTSIYASLVFFGFLYSPVNLLLSIIFNYFSRRHEYQADKYAALTTGKAHDLIQALKILSKSNLSNLTPHPFEVLLHYSHPPVLLRIFALRHS